MFLFLGLGKPLVVVLLLDRVLTSRAFCLISHPMLEYKRRPLHLPGSQYFQQNLCLDVRKPLIPKGSALRCVLSLHSTRKQRRQMSLCHSTYFQTISGDFVAVGDAWGVLRVFLMSEGCLLNRPNTTLCSPNANSWKDLMLIVILLPLRGKGCGAPRMEFG